MLDYGDSMKKETVSMQLAREERERLDANTQELARLKKELNPQ